jgi:ankyrin repeat protein
MFTKVEQSTKKTVLNTLCCSADSEGVQKYLNSNSGMNVNYDQGTPFILAIRSIQVHPAPAKEKCLATLKVLIDAGADIHINEDAPLFWALKVNNHAAVNLLLSLGNDFHVDASVIAEYVNKNESVVGDIRDRLEAAKVFYDDDSSTVKMGS